MNASRSIHIVLLLFTSVTLTHAGFVDYRSGADEIRPANSQANHQEMSPLQSYPPYLQTRKFIELHSIFREISDACKTKIWRGLTKSEWIKNGLCCGVFDLLIKMAGGKTRIKLLGALVSPKNKLQLSRDVGIDWKAVDKHIDRLGLYGLVAEVAVAGTCRVYAITEKGSRALILAEREVCMDTLTARSDQLRM